MRQEDPTGWANWPVEWPWGGPPAGTITDQIGNWMGSEASGAPIDWDATDLHMYEGKVVLTGSSLPESMSVLSASAFLTNRSRTRHDCLECPDAQFRGWSRLPRGQAWRV